MRINCEIKYVVLESMISQNKLPKNIDYEKNF